MIGFDGTRVLKKARGLVSDQLFALELREAVQKQTMSRASARLSTDVAAFRLLREKDGVSVERIDAAMQYHCNNLRSKFHPKAYTATDFRKKFVRIEQALLNSDQPVEEIQLNQHVTGILVRVRALGWKRGSAELLNNEVYYSWSFLSNFRSYLYELSIGDSEWKTVAGILNERVPRNWVESWYSQLHTRLHNWSEWNGKLSNFRMTINNQDFAARIIQILQEYSGKKGYSLAIKLMENFDENKQTRQHR